MLEPAAYGLGALVATIAATGAGLLALLSWSGLRETPVGTIVGLLSLTLVGVALYHVGLLMGLAGSLALESVRSAVHTSLAVVVWLALRSHRRIQHRASEG